MPPSTTRKTPHSETVGGVAASLPKHGRVAQALSAEIQRGKYKVGDLLPSEALLSLRFGVSRHTVRAALQTLQGLGLVSSHQGVGTQVRERHPVPRYSHSFTSAEDLLQYATSTPVRTLDRKEVAVTAAMAAQFGCEPGEHWWRVRTVRMDPASRTVVAYSEIHIPLAFGAVLAETAKSRQPIFALIERRFQEAIVEIQQDITCIARLRAEEATQLQVARNAPGMEITRRYIGRKGRVLEVARSVHPSEVFRYSMRVQLRHESDS
ncbi:GntR family transcriptional regulator [Ramlibacter sp.]|uniref:GntR family transcriptional regulator n=1 Tax=Ramlibacter sp. TaxID=1917967 RepID=UPI00261D81D0|nr:GntR family transcriptional regulator [Ramlibacter sp.]MDB5957478.1 GntR family transcriptional regulator [Ramlibacter sp.]